MEKDMHIKINENEAYECLKMIRTAPGKIYEYELYHKLNRPELAKSGQNMAQMINDLFELEFAVCDIEESSYNESGLNVIYTNPEYRLILDLLLSSLDFQLDRTVYIDYTEEVVEQDKAIIRVYYTSLEKVLNQMLLKHPDHFYILKAINIFKSWTQKIEMDVMTLDDIAKEYQKGTLNLSGKYIIDFNYDRLTKILQSPPVFVNFKADGAFFTGSCIDFSNAQFMETASFKGSIFKCHTLSFKKAKFQMNSPENKLCGDVSEVTFRNSRLFVQNILFDEIVFDGNAEKKALSFEDAVIDAQYISFSKMNLVDTELFFYQTIMEEASIRFIESQIDSAQLNFEDSVVNKIIMINITAIPETMFNFRRCRNLIIENCNIEKNITLTGMEILSLRNCKNQGKILTDWSDKVKDKNGNKNFPILLAIINNTDNNSDKAEQFILLKENFQNQGQYDYEDEAFIQYMIYKHKNSYIKCVYTFLRVIGQYGISPLRILTTMMIVILFFTVVNLISSYILPNAFSFITEDCNFFNIFAKSFYLSISNLVSYDSEIFPHHLFTIIASILESITGWFLLGYLSVAIVRKTLR